MTARGISIATGLTALAWAGPALAHVAEAGEPEASWSTWALSPDVVIPTALVVAAYVAGARRRRGSPSAGQWERHGLFFAGVAAVFLSLQSPVDPMAEHLFWVHQVQHLLLRMLGPMLITLAWPAGLLTAGLRGPRGGSLAAPVVSNRVVRGIFAVLWRPAVATGLFVAALYVWQIPSLHDLALESEPVHYLMHVTMLAAGLLFWQRIFDRRPGPSPIDISDGRGLHGLGYGARLMMLWLVALSNIVLGAYLALKHQVLYVAYGMGPRPMGLSPLQDEQAGGFIIWMPSSMMCLVAILVIIHWWGLEEERLERRRVSQAGSNSAALLWPTTAAALIEQARPRNRRLALGFAAFVATVFFTAIFIGVMATRPHAAGAPAHRLAHAGEALWVSAGG